MTVTLRQRKKGNKISLYLDYYSDGKREYEYLQLYIIPEPEKGKLTKEQKEENRNTLNLAEAIRSKRLLQLKNEEYGFRDTDKAKGSFIAYFEVLTEKRKGSKGNWGNWDSVLKHLKKFAKNGASFKDIDKKWLENFKTYLNDEVNIKSNIQLTQNSQASYFGIVIAALKEAVKDGIIQANPANQVEGIRSDDPDREFLTLEELQAAAKVDCEIPVLKNAFIFSALSGLRWSDIEKLVWSEVQHSEQSGYYIRFRQKTTRGAETLPISEQSISFLGERRKQEDKVFEGLTYSAWHNTKLREWLKKAGINKHITFHCARHTYATLQISLGTDIYTVSKLLGHRSLKTTEIYAKVIDHKKQESANKIKLDL
jgi:integrase